MPKARIVVFPTDEKTLSPAQRKAQQKMAKFQPSATVLLQIAETEASLQDAIAFYSPLVVGDAPDLRLAAGEPDAQGYRAAQGWFKKGLDRENGYRVHLLEMPQGRVRISYFKEAKK